MAMRLSQSDTPKKKRKRSEIVIVFGDKGGTGKSFTARAIAAWLRRRGYIVVGFDGDTRNGHLSRYYAASCDVSRVELRDAEGWAIMYQAWEQVADNAIILLDLPGNIGDMIEAETNRLPLLADSLDRNVIGAWVASEEEDSIWLLPTALQVATAEKMLFVMNGRFGADPSKFELWNGSRTRAEFIHEGGAETFLPVLPIFPRAKVARARCPFDEVSRANFGTLEQIDFEIWWAGVESAFEPLTKLLGARP